MKKQTQARSQVTLPTLAALPTPAPVAQVAIPQVAAPTPAEGSGVSAPRPPGRPAGARSATATNIVLAPDGLKNMLEEIPGLADLQLPSNPIPWTDAERNVFLSAYGGKIEKAPEVLQTMLNGPKGHEKATLAQIAETGGGAKIDFVQIKGYVRRMGEIMTAQAQMFDENPAVVEAATARLAELQAQGEDDSEE